MQVKILIFSFGSFPRENLLKDVPDVLYRDSLDYYRPYIQGLFWQYTKGNFTQTAYLDWTSRKTDDVRETFIMGGHGRYKHGLFFVDNFLYMYHYANKDEPDRRDPITVRDNGIIYLRLGGDFSKKTSLDSLSIGVAGIKSFERVRRFEDMITCNGVNFELTASYKDFQVSNTLYLGEGHDMDWGDPFYRLKSYNRSEISYTLLDYKRVNAKFSAILHFAENKRHHHQLFTITVDLNRRGTY
ncbi:hypothetical protein QA597_02770 [Marinilabiliaceae bacterium ANBcel2]|nr:hypothetical protein [Marinilabiliaceae bacterium ANBcel2]